MLTIIGDVHGKIKAYKEIIKCNDKTVCVGDFGFRKEHLNHSKYKNGKNHKIILGNHDYRGLEKFSHALGAYGLINHGIEFFYISGAYSIDKRNRVSGVDWFYNEELNIIQLNDCINEFERCKPRVVISHDCPNRVAKIVSGKNHMESTRTQQAMDAMVQIHQPDLWVFGHHHKSFNGVIDGTRFICLKELETFKL